MPANTRILIIGEGVTLAHVGRPLVVAEALAEAGYNVTFACDKRFLKLVDLQNLSYAPVASLDSQLFVNRVAAGKPLFSSRELEAMIAEDRRLLRELRPALVIGDLRWSLGISARLESVPYAAVSNAYWSPYATGRQWVLPNHPAMKHFGFSVAQRVFRLIRPFAFARMTLPYNRVRRRYGLSSIGWDYCRIFEDADFVLFPDMHQLHPTLALPPTHQYIGPIHWSPSVPLPEWWNELSDDLPVVYVNLGSSGDLTLLPAILGVLSGMRVQTVVATANRGQFDAPANVFLTDYLPGLACARRAQLAITNGGSMTIYQCLSQGVPILGIVSLIDQYLSMKPVTDAGAGTLLCPPFATSEAVHSAVSKMLHSPSFKENARRLQSHCSATFNSAPLLRAIKHITGGAHE